VGYLINIGVRYQFIIDDISVLRVLSQIIEISTIMPYNYVIGIT